MAAGRAPMTSPVVVALVAELALLVALLRTARR
jgi:hypothetical protein